MNELFFVLKCMAITIALTVLMQVRVGNSSLEQESQWFLQKSTVSIYIQSVAAGGALAIKNLYMSTKNGIMGTADSFRQGSKAQARK
jgi:hypothetical protein